MVITNKINIKQKVHLKYYLFFVVEKYIVSISIKKYIIFIYFFDVCFDCDNNI